MNDLPPEVSALIDRIVNHSRIPCSDWVDEFIEAIRKADDAYQIDAAAWIIGGLFVAYRDRAAQLIYTQEGDFCQEQVRCLLGPSSRLGYEAISAMAIRRMDDGGTPHADVIAAAFDEAWRLANALTTPHASCYNAANGEP